MRPCFVISTNAHQGFWNLNLCEILDGIIRIQTTHFFFKWAKDVNRHFIKETYRWQTGTWKGVQHHELIKKYKVKPQWDIIIHLLEWLKLKILTIPSVDSDVEHLVFSRVDGGNTWWIRTFWTAAFENRLAASHKVKLTIQPSSPIPRNIPKRKENVWLQKKKNYRSFIHKSQNLREQRLWSR